MKGTKKRNAAPSGKRAKPKKEATTNGDPEWDDLEERFSSLNADFRQLAEMVGKD